MKKEKRSGKWASLLYQIVRKHDHPQYWSNGKISRPERAWAAGIFDGEGWVGLRANGAGKRKRHISVMVAQKDRHLLDRFSQVVAIAEGKVVGPYKSGSHCAMHYYRLHGLLPILKLFLTLKPWLAKPKLDQFVKSFTDLLTF